jgi:hypothetical protein
MLARNYSLCSKSQKMYDYGPLLQLRTNLAGRRAHTPQLQNYFRDK